VDSLSGHQSYNKLLEVGPGTGVLSDILIQQNIYDLLFMDVDQESIDYLKVQHPDYSDQIILEDFLRMDVSKYFNEPFGIIGNFPYNISSQIFFKVLEYRNQIPEVVGMIQKEVGERIAAKEGNKTYGILSVLIQAFYDVEYLFSVPPNVFNPPPKVTSAVLRLKRNETETLDCDEKLFFRVVKQGFNNRRKTLRNALKSFDLTTEQKSLDLLDKRAEQLTVNDFVELTNLLADGES
jgi:16S rRNA (adenine1518-N6/adenine1519-N6)-dimethyltransferase